MAKRMRSDEPVPGGGGSPPNCLLCKTTILEVRVTANTSGGVQNTVTAVQMLLRHLNIDKKAFFGYLPSIGKGEEEEEEGLVWWEFVGRSLCEPCSVVTNKFWQVYQEFEVLRLLLEECVGKVKERLGNAGGDGATKTACGPPEDGGLTGELMRKCALQLVSNPRVAVKDIGVKSLNQKPSSVLSEELPVPVFKAQFPSATTTSATESVIKKEGPAANLPNCPLENGVDGKLQSNPDRGEKLGGTSELKYSSSPAIGSEITDPPPVARRNNSVSDPNLNPSKPDTRRRGWACRLCGMCFANGKILQRHMDLHNNKASADRNCRHCGQVSNTAVDHRRHVLCNHPIEFFSDDLPSGTTQQQLEAGLQLLFRKCETVEDNGGEEAYKCSICRELFAGTFELRVHNLETHFETVVELLEDGRSGDSKQKSGKPEQVTLTPLVHTEYQNNNTPSTSASGATSYASANTNNTTQLEPDQGKEGCGDLTGSSSSNGQVVRSQVVVTTVPGILKEEVWIEEDEDLQFPAEPMNVDEQSVHESVVNIQDFASLDSEEEGNPVSTSVDPLGEMESMETEVDYYPVQQSSESGDVGLVEIRQKCSICDKLVPSSKSLLEHYRTDHMGAGVAGPSSASSSAASLFSCGFCHDSNSYSVNDLRRHEITNHIVDFFSKDVKGWPSATTDKQLRQVLGAQIKRIDGGGGRTFECRHCLKPYNASNMVWFFFHLRLKHLKEILSELHACGQQHSDNISSNVLEPRPGGERDPPKKKIVREPQPHTDGKIYPKPALTYFCLAGMALKNSTTGSLPVSGIYKFICDHFPYFKSAPSGWKNSVRHNLSIAKWFDKIEVPGTRFTKGHRWALNPGRVYRIEDEVQKCFRKDGIEEIRRAMPNPENLELIVNGELKRDYSEAGAADEDEDEDLSWPASPQVQDVANSSGSTWIGSGSAGVVTPVITPPVSQPMLRLRLQPGILHEVHLLPVTGPSFPADQNVGVVYPEEEEVMELQFSMDGNGPSS